MSSLGLLALQPFVPRYLVNSSMHKEDYEGLAFGAEWSAVFHPDFQNPFVVAYFRRAGAPPIDRSWLFQQVLEDFGSLMDNNYVSNVNDKGVLFGCLSPMS